MFPRSTKSEKQKKKGKHLAPPKVSSKAKLRKSGDVGGGKTTVDQEGRPLCRYCGHRVGPNKMKGGRIKMRCLSVDCRKYAQTTNPKNASAEEFSETEKNKKIVFPLTDTMLSSGGGRLCGKCGYTVRRKNPVSKFWRCWNMECRRWYSDSKYGKKPLTECKYCKGDLGVETRSSGKKRYRCLACRKWQKGVEVIEEVQSDEHEERQPEEPRVVTESLPNLDQEHTIPVVVERKEIEEDELDVVGLTDNDVPDTVEFEETVEIEIPTLDAGPIGQLGPAAPPEVKKEMVVEAASSKIHKKRKVKSDFGADTYEVTSSEDSDTAIAVTDGLVGKKGTKKAAPVGKRGSGTGLKVNLGGPRDKITQSFKKAKPKSMGMPIGSLVAKRGPSFRAGESSSGVQPEGKKGKSKRAIGEINVESDSESSTNEDYLPQAPSPLPEWALSYKPGYIETKSRWWLHGKARKRNPSPNRRFGIETVDCAAAFRMAGRCLEQLGERLQSKPDDSFGAIDGSLDLLLDTLMSSFAPLLSLIQLTPSTNVLPKERLEDLWESSAVHVPMWQS